MSPRSSFARVARRLVLVAGAGAGAVLSASPSVAQVVGTELQVNSYTTGTQGRPAITADAAGNFVVVWESYHDGDQAGVFGQRFSVAGAAQGSEFQINTITTWLQWLPSVAARADGNFVAVWSGQENGIPGLEGVFGQRYSSAGASQGTEFLINSYTTSVQSGAVVASDALGNFVVAWNSFYGFQDGDEGGVFAQRYDSTGALAGTEFQVNAYTTNHQRIPSIAANADGDFVIVWQSKGQDGDEEGVFARRYDSSGTPLGTEFQVNTYTTGFQADGRVAVDDAGNFVIVWHSDSVGTISADPRVFARRYNSAGNPAGTEFAVHSYATSIHRLPAVDTLGSGDFVVVWQSYRDGSNGSISGRMFDASGAPQSDEFQVNTYTTYIQIDAEVAYQAPGRFVVTWNSGNGQDGSGAGVFARPLCADLDNNAICDDAEPCVGPQPVTIKPKVVLKKINTDAAPDNDGLSIGGEFVLPPASSFATLNPIADGARVMLEREDGSVAVDVTIPGGAFNGTTGWSVNGAGNKYSFVDKTKPPLNNGIAKLQMQDRSSKAPKQIKIKVAGKGGNYPVVAGDEPIKAVIIVGDGTMGECAETAFVPGTCLFNGSGTTLTCAP